MTTVLKLGSKGIAVARLQTLLNAAGTTPPLAPDGDFGAKTEQRVRAFQDDRGLVIDGVVGPQTFAALKQAATPAKTTKPEPPKAAILEPVEDHPPVSSSLKAPPNASALKLLDTARPINEIIIHCTATPEGRDFTVEDIRSWHKQRGWSDIGYHYVVYRDGRVMVGRPVGQVGSHVAGHNTGTIGIAYVGGVTADSTKAKDTRTEAQRSSLLWLVDQLARKFRVRKVTGHSAYAQKACPSFDVSKDPLSALV